MDFSLVRNFRSSGSDCAERGSAGGFRALLGEAAWARLAEAIRLRFATLPRAGAPRVFRGNFGIVRRSLAGWGFAWLSRWIGHPLPLGRGEDIPARVVVRRLPDGGVEWHRDYLFVGGGERCSTVKRAAGHCLLECVGRRFGMELALSEEQGALHFRSTRFFVALAGRRLTWPLLLSPGRMHVLHEAAAGDAFRFRLEVRHPLFGLTFLQDGLFEQREG